MKIFGIFWPFANVGKADRLARDPRDFTAF